MRRSGKIGEMRRSGKGGRDGAGGLGRAERGGIRRRTAATWRVRPWASRIGGGGGERRPAVGEVRPGRGGRTGMGGEEWDPADDRSDLAGVALGERRRWRAASVAVGGERRRGGRAMRDGWSVFARVDY